MEAKGLTHPSLTKRCEGRVIVRARAGACAVSMPICSVFFGCVGGQCAHACMCAYRSDGYVF